MKLERITPEQAGISSRHILAFLKEAEASGIEMHSLMFLRRGKVFAEGWWEPYNAKSPHAMFSFTKSLTSTAIGFARQEGLLELSDRLADFFPEQLPENPNKNLLDCTVRDLLTMGCGHEAEIPLMGRNNKDWIAAFLAQPFVYTPGTHFMYNTAGTNMLCAILKKVSGQDLLPFLTPRLFEPLGMDSVVCAMMPDGTQMGGAGSRLVTEDMARFTQFVADKGRWQGRQLLSDQWFALATAKQIDNSATGATPDWQAGYGFQFWRCAPDASTFRGDGAFGQFGVICEKEEAVFAITSASTDLQRPLDLLWKHLKPHFCPDPLPEDTEGHLLLAAALDSLQLNCPLGHRQPEAQRKYSGQSYQPQEPLTGGWPVLIGGAGIFRPGIDFDDMATLTTLTVEFTDDECRLISTLGERRELLPISLTGRYSRFALGPMSYGAVGRWIGPDEFEFDARCAEAVTGVRFTLHFSPQGLTLSSRPSFPQWGGLADEKKADIRFLAKK